jgi:hypothetical protein
MCAATSAAVSDADDALVGIQGEVLIVMVADYLPLSPTWCEGEEDG